MSNYDALRLQDFDAIEFAVEDLDVTEKIHQRLGFERVGVREIRERKLRSLLLAQGQALVILNQSSDSKDPVARYVRAHGDGVINIILRCDDAVTALETAVSRGAVVAESPRTSKKDFGTITFASIKAFGDVRHTFLSREGDLIAEGFDTPYRLKSMGTGILRFDHLTTNVEQGQLAAWTEFYEKILGFTSVRYFDIHTQRTGLYSRVMQSANGMIKMPVNEPSEAASQIQEFIDTHHGPGVQHAALTTNNILETLPVLQRADIPFLTAPPTTYYEAVSQRLPNVTESLNELQRLGVLVDGDAKGYLLQIFSQPLIGPFFYEVIQRRGNDGFGEGNFTALFESIERDQIRRGVLKP